MKLIYLGTGKEYCALVDDEDYEYLNQFRWRVGRDKWNTYARRHIRINGSRTEQFMHNLIMGLIGVDHIDGDGLNNQRENLRVASASQNGGNRKKSSGTYTSQYKGVSFYQPTQKWLARLGKHYLGYHNTEIEAALAYNEFALKYFGAFAKLNEVSNG